MSTIDGPRPTPELKRVWLVCKRASDAYDQECMLLGNALVRGHPHSPRRAQRRLAEMERASKAYDALRAARNGDGE